MSETKRELDAESKRVLLVAGSADDVRDLRCGLEESECMVTFVRSVAHARKLLEADDFDMLITESYLPDGSGVSLIQDADSLGMDRLLVRKAEYI
jgi:DNA-binding NtrC family response regulator